MIPEAALKPCQLATVPTDREFMWAELEATYLLRGQQLVQCSLARPLAVKTLLAERAAARRSEDER